MRPNVTRSKLKLIFISTILLDHNRKSTCVDYNQFPTTSTHNSINKNPYSFTTYYTYVLCVYNIISIHLYSLCASQLNRPSQFTCNFYCPFYYASSSACFLCYMYLYRGINIYMYTIYGYYEYICWW